MVDIALSDRDGFGLVVRYALGDRRGREPVYLGRILRNGARARDAARMIYDKLKVEQRELKAKRGEIRKVCGRDGKCWGRARLPHRLGPRRSGKLWVKIGDFDQDIMLLNFRNGTVDLRTGQLLPHEPLRSSSQTDSDRLRSKTRIKRSGASS